MLAALGVEVVKAILTFYCTAENCEGTLVEDHTDQDNIVVNPCDVCGRHYKHEELS